MEKFGEPTINKTNKKNEVYTHDILEEEKKPLHNQEEYVYLQEFINTKLMNSIEDDLTLNGYTPEESATIMSNLEKMSSTDQHWFMATPWSLRQKYFKGFHEKLVSGAKDIGDFLKPLVDASAMQMRHVGYHCSSHKIEPKEERVGDSSKSEMNWAIKGTEKDHRNNDLPMAYYSTDLHSLYFDKNPKYLYMVAFSTKLGSGHHRDNDGSWGRAAALDVISSFEIDEFKKFWQDKKESTEK